MANLSIHFIKHLCFRTVYRQYKYAISPCFTSKRRFSSTSPAFEVQRRYGDKHEWVTVNGNIGTVGITHYAQESLGEVVYVELPQINAKCQADDNVGVIESVKAVNELCTPVSGCILEVNTKLEDKPGLVNESCYDEGWIFKIELSDASEPDKLMTDEQYEEYLKSME